MGPHQALAGFMNAHGGTLLVGITDDGDVSGLEADFPFLKKQDCDGWELLADRCGGKRAGQRRCGGTRSQDRVARRTPRRTDRCRALRGASVRHATERAGKTGIPRAHQQHHAGARGPGGPRAIRRSAGRADTGSARGLGCRWAATRQQATSGRQTRRGCDRPGETELQPRRASRRPRPCPRRRRSRRCSSDGGVRQPEALEDPTRVARRARFAGLQSRKPRERIG